MNKAKALEAAAEKSVNQGGVSAAAPPSSPHPKHDVGHTDISVRALVNTARAVVSERLQVPIKHISVSIFDDEGCLGLTVDTPLTWGLIADTTRPNASILDRLDASRLGIVERMTQVSGRQVGQINFEISGVTRAKKLSQQGRNLL